MSFLLLASCASLSPVPSNNLEAVVRERVAQVDSGTVAVSFIDLGSGREWHINGDVSLHAASTMKVPVLMELFHQAEEGVRSLDDLIEVRNVFQSIADTSHYSLDANDDSDSTVYKLIGQKVPL